MPRKKIGEEENKKISSVENTKVDIKEKGKVNKLENKKSVKEKLPKPIDKKALPKTKAKKELPKPIDKKALPKTKVKKELPKTKTKKMLPKASEKKLLDKSLTAEEKTKKLLEKIKEFFENNPEKTSKIDSKIDKKTNFLAEYYDLPYRYNETIVKILAQTPKRLFIYWDISDKDIEKYRRAFGEDFFEKTYPVLLVHNEELNYTYEIPINDFANSWYLDIKDSKCKYTVQLGRKFKSVPKLEIETEQIIREENINLKNDYLEIVSSNTLEAPNDSVLLDDMKPTITYRNVKNGQETTKEITHILNGFAKVYNIYDLYKVLYKEEFKSETFDLNNPSSVGNSSSSMFK